MKSLADLTVTTKAVERTAEAIGQDILEHQQQQIRPPSNWIARRGRTAHSHSLHPDRRHWCTRDHRRNARPARQTTRPAAATREAKLGCVFTQTEPTPKVVRSETKTPPATSAPLNAEEFGLRIYTEAWRRG